MSSSTSIEWTKSDAGEAGRALIVGIHVDEPQIALLTAGVHLDGVP
jgi:hypothetical protein